MDARTDESTLTTLRGDELAIGIQISAQVGKNRTMTLTSGVPLDMSIERLNGYLDKMNFVIDRQNWRGELEAMKSLVLQAQAEIVTSIEQQRILEDKFRGEFDRSGRHGEWRASDAQEKQLNNYRLSQINLRDNIIPKYLKDIADLEAKIAGE